MANYVCMYVLEEELRPLAPYIHYLVKKVKETNKAKNRAYTREYKCCGRKPTTGL